MISALDFEVICHWALTAPAETETNKIASKNGVSVFILLDFRLFV
jgi:hypothetical protein